MLLVLQTRNSVNEMVMNVQAAKLATLYAPVWAAMPLTPA